MNLINPIPRCEANKKMNEKHAKNIASSKSKKEKTPAQSEIEDEEVQDMNAAAETTTEAPIKKSGV